MLNEDTLFFYIPGIFGDEPKQAALRLKISSRFRIIVTDLPGSNYDRAVLCDLSKTGSIVAENMIRLQKNGEINIIGFSFGASLAVEIACYLTRAGRTIGYLGLVDCPLKLENMRRSVRGMVELLAAPRGIPIVSKNLVQVLMNLYNHWIRSRPLSRKPNYDELTECRFEALRKWKPKSCNARGVLLLSIFNFERSHRNWKVICPNCKQIKVRSDHHNILIGESLDRVSRLMDDEISSFLQQSE